jgi:hypothetical protein
MAGPDNIRGFGTTLAENIRSVQPTLRENGPTITENSPTTSARTHINRERLHVALDAARSGRNWSTAANHRAARMILTTTCAKGKPGRVPESWLIGTGWSRAAVLVTGVAVLLAR